jgi:hypothetical protein
MERETLKTIAIISFLVSGAAFFMFFVLAGSMGGCYIQTQVGITDNPQNIDVEVQPGTCTQRFVIINHEEGLNIYAIKGDVIIYDDGIGTLDDVISCPRSLGGSDWSSEVVRPVDDARSCTPISLKVNQRYEIQRVQGSWELFTDKGSVKGYTTYYNTLGMMNMAFLVTSAVSGVIFVITLVLMAFSGKKK